MNQQASIESTKTTTSDSSEVRWDHWWEAPDGVPTLLDGILDGNGSELALLLRVVLNLMVMHHSRDNITCKVTEPYTDLADLVQQLDRGPVEWIDHEPQASESSTPNPDAEAMRTMIYATARVTLIKALLHCVAVQRRYVTGTIYDDGQEAGGLLAKARSDPRVRWARYRPWPETDVEALMAYVHDHEHISIAGVYETLEAADQWRRWVVPSIRQHYRRLEWRYQICGYMRQAVQQGLHPESGGRCIHQETIQQEL